MQNQTTTKQIRRKRRLELKDHIRDKRCAIFVSHAISGPHVSSRPKSESRKLRVIIILKNVQVVHFQKKKKNEKKCCYAKENITALHKPNTKRRDSCIAVPFERNERIRYGPYNITAGDRGNLHNKRCFWKLRVTVPRRLLYGEIP